MQQKTFRSNIRLYCLGIKRYCIARLVPLIQWNYFDALSKIDSKALRKKTKLDNKDNAHNYNGNKAESAKTKQKGGGHQQCIDGRASKISSYIGMLATLRDALEKTCPSEEMANGKRLGYHVTCRNSLT